MKTLTFSVLILALAACAPKAPKQSGPAAPVARPTVAGPVESQPMSDVPAVLKVQPIGADGKCTPEFEQAWPKHLAELTRTSGALDGALNRMEKKLQNPENLTAKEQGDVVAAYAAFKTAFAEYQDAFEPYVCWVKTPMGAKMNLSSDLETANFKRLKKRVGATIGNHLL